LSGKFFTHLLVIFYGSVIIAGYFYLIRIPSMQFSVLSQAGFSLDLPTDESWMQWARGECVVSGSDVLPPLTHIPPMLRRRLSTIGRIALYAANQADPHGRADKRVYCSRHGDIYRTLTLLEDLVTTGAVSPAEFSVSVHNAIGALQGIAMQDACDYTTISAGQDNAVAGLVEACAFLKAGASSVLLVLYDELLPPLYQPYLAEPTFSYGFAILLTQVDLCHGHYCLTYHPTDSSQRTYSDLEVIRCLLLNTSLTTGNWSLTYHAA
jgi:hypothetical protein